MLDTNVWLDVLVFGDPRVEALAAALASGRARALVGPGMRAEFERVLAYPALALDPGRQAAARAAFASVSSIGSPTGHGPDPDRAPRCADPDDQMFVDLALAAGADALLSRDDALLRMATRLRALGIPVMTPAAWCAARGALQIPKR